METKLEPCPFCGQLPEITKHFKHDAWGLMHRCPIVGPISFEFGDRRRHVAAWNHRTPGPATAKMLELCRDTIDRSWLNAPSLELCAAFITENEPAAKEVTP